MSTHAMSAVGGALLMWALAVAWWWGSDRSPAVTMGAIAIGGLGTAIAFAGANKPAPSRPRALVAAGLGLVVAAALAYLVGA